MKHQGDVQMDWKRRFQNLVRLEQKRREELAQEEERRKVELQRIVKTYMPQIDRVCSSFAKAVGWEYEKPSRGHFELRGYRYPLHYRDYYSFDITILSDRIDISGSKHAYLHSKSVQGDDVYNDLVSERSWNKSQSISLSEFVEEKIAQVFEQWYLL